MAMNKSLDNTDRTGVAVIAGDRRLVFADLIARLEKATGPDRQTDRAIFEAICLEEQFKKFGAESWFCSVDCGSYGFNTGRNPATIWCGALPEFTGSIDPALTLLPEWASYELTRSAAGEPTFTRCRLWDWRRGPMMSNPGNEWKAEGNRPLPINICIAALKAQEPTNG